MTCITAITYSPRWRCSVEFEARVPRNQKLLGLSKNHMQVLYVVQASRA
jgi:hypothetical protein